MSSLGPTPAAPMAASDVAQPSESPVAPGVVYLVGAGPGGVGLLTVRAVEVLSCCDVVLHDRLVSAEIVRLARPSAQVSYVGKDKGVSSDVMKVQQDDISGQLVEFARRGLSVCRLKGGDPMIFGRAGEEMEVLAAAHVPYEVVPAVTAALAAAADSSVPLTFRKLAISLSVHTVNNGTLKDPSWDWAQFARPSTTFAIYMGLGTLASVCECLMAAGVAPETPMAVVDRASLPSSQFVAGTVATLPASVKGRDDLTGPALVLLGSAVAVRERLIAPRSTAPPPPEPALATALAMLPSLDATALRTLKRRIDETLDVRLAATAGEHTDAAADGEGFNHKRTRPGDA